MEQRFAVFPSLQVAANGHTLGQISFMQPMNMVGATRQPREDGVLPTAVFPRVFVSYRGQFAILEPRY